MNINPQIVNMLKGGNPKQMVMNMLQQNMNGNPLLQNVFNMANTNNVEGAEQIARNMAKAKGINADEIYNQISSLMK